MQTEAGTTIALSPCSSDATYKWVATSDKWTIVEPDAGRSFIWSIRSDYNGMCLEARPESAASPVGVQGSATLIQMPCNNSDSQRFNNVDADWLGQNQPR
jgi:hypothetical protein